LGSKFREAALQDCEQDERAGILTLSDRLRNICFVQGLYSDRIQTIVRSRNYDNFDEIAETALEEESAIISKNERYRSSNMSSDNLKCSNCGRNNHVTSRCFLKGKKDVRVNQFSARHENRGPNRDIICFDCSGKGHIARKCTRPRKKSGRSDVTECKPGSNDSGKRITTIGKWQSTDGPVYSIGCAGRKDCEFLKLKVNISKTGELLLLIDSGADVSVLKGKNLIGSTKYDPERKVRVKSVSGSLIETHGAIEAVIELRNSSITHEFQLVNKQVDIPCEGILGRDFFQHAKAQICYETQSVNLNGEVIKMVNANKTEIAKIEKTRETRKIKLPRRSECVVKLPVKEKSPLVGILDKQEIQEGIFMAGSLTKVITGYVITSILNTNDEEVEIQEPLVELEDIESVGDLTGATEEKQRDREKRILKQLRLDHLNDEEKKLLIGTCQDYQDIFYLPGDTLSSTNATRHSIRVQPGTEPINTRPYRLPETQKVEVERQVEKLLKEGIIEESNSPWNSPILVVA
jgi:hypothetical protein